MKRVNLLLPENVKKQIHFILIIVFITALAFGATGCSGDEKNNSRDLLSLLALSSSTHVEPIEPDPDYTGSNCSCGAKTSGGSTLSVSRDDYPGGALVSESTTGNGYVPDEVLVKFRDGITQSRAEGVMNTFGGSNIKNIIVRKGGAQSLVKHVRLNRKRSVEQAIKDYSAVAEVEYAQPNYIYRAFATYPNDPDFTSQWGLHNTGQTIGDNTGIVDKDIHAPEAWDIVNDCSSVIVAVVDTGINYNQRDLAGNMWDGGASYPNHGYDFANNDNDPMDLNGHGTHVAGIIGADGNSGAGLCGVCWKVRLMAVRVLDAAGNGTTATIVSGINFAVANGAHVINISLGGSADDAALKSAIESARTSGVIVVAAAGNSGSKTYNYPAGYTSTSKCTNCDNIISVGALDQRGNLANFSSYGTDWVDIAAPGVMVLSAWPGQSVTTRENFGDWTRETDWGVGTYAYNGPFGPINFTLLTNPGQWYRTWYKSNLNSAAYKVFDLEAYGADSARVDYYRDYNIDSDDSLAFVVDPDGGRPGSELYSITGSSSGLRYAGSYDMTGYLGPNTTMGFLFRTGSGEGDFGAGIGLFEVTRLYLNTTACRYLDGTSMSAPHVAGAAALCIARYMSKNGSYDRVANYQAIISSLLNNSETYTSLNNRITGSRMLNVYKAVQGI